MNQDWRPPRPLDPAIGADASYVAPGDPIARALPVFKTASVFCSEYMPLAYAIEGLVRSGSLYTVTARTGAGKTALLISMALAVSANRKEVLGAEVEPGRVAYVACENPDDIRMRLMTAAFAKNVELAAVGSNLMVLDRRYKPEELLEELSRLAEAAPFRMILIDTLAAFFDGDNINDAVQGGEFMRRLRPLTQIAGLPSVLVAAHPVKNAAVDNLVPYGSGAILNEVDGNLTLWKDPDTGTVSLHWAGKLRGLEFDPRTFRFDLASSPDVVDVKGRQVQLPLLEPLAATDATARAEAEDASDFALLKAMAAEPEARQEDWGLAIGRSKTVVNKKLQRMARAPEKLVDCVLGKYRITPKGQKALGAT